MTLAEHEIHSLEEGEIGIYFYQVEEHITEERFDTRFTGKEVILS